MTDSKLTLSILPDTLAIARLDANAAIPHWAPAGNFFAITRTLDELSVVCSQTSVPDEIKCDQGWRCLKVEGPFDFSVTGIVASLAAPLARAGVSIFVISTYDTDYLLVKQENVEKAILVLTEQGHAIEPVSP
jgi:hypothetical protein